MSQTARSTTYTFDPYKLDPAKRQLLDGSAEPVLLRGKAYDLLLHLVENRGRLVTKAELLESLWPGVVVEENNLNQAMSALRQALDDDAKTPRYISTIKGRGYQFVGEVSADPGAMRAKAGSTDRAAPRISWRLPVALLLVLGIAGAVVWHGRDTEEPQRIQQVIEHFSDARLSLVTDYPGSHNEPTLSPDGLMMAYVSDASGLPQIWVKNLQRGDPIQITHGTYPARSPSWSSSGNQIIFESVANDLRAILTVGTLGKPEPRVLVPAGTSPSYSSGSAEFVYSQDGIWIAKNDGRDREPVIGLPQSQGFASRDPALSPDGQRIAFVHANEGPFGNLWIISASGGNARQLTFPDTGGGHASVPAWSPDGRNIVYTVNIDIGGSHLWRVNVDSGETAPITTGPGGAGHATFSADGSRLAYSTTRTIWRLTRIDPATGEATGIHDSRQPILLPVASADGRTIVYFSQVASGMQLFTIGNDGENLRQLTFDEPGENALPTWAGDGESILYYRGRSLYQLNPKDGSDTEVFADFHWSSRNWLSAYEDRITFHNIDRPTATQRTVVRKLGESAEIELPVPIEAAQWSKDGSELVGWHRRSGELLICRPGASSCQTIDSDGSPVQGARPAWTTDGEGIYYLNYTDAGQCCSIWRIGRDGSGKTKVADLPGYEFSNSYYGIAADGSIFYNHLDRSADEIWLAEIYE